MQVIIRDIEDEDVIRIASAGLSVIRASLHEGIHKDDSCRCRAALHISAVVWVTPARLSDREFNPKKDAVKCRNIV